MKNRPKYAVVRVDRMSSTKDPALLKSAKFFVGNTPTEIENASIVAIGDLLEGEREIYKATTPATSSTTAPTTIDKLALVTTPEMWYCECGHKDLEDFINEADEPIRINRFTHGDTFSVTAEAFYNKEVPEVDDKISFNGTKLCVSSGSGVTIGKVAHIESDNFRTWYVIDVAL